MSASLDHPPHVPDSLHLCVTTCCIIVTASESPVIRLMMVIQRRLLITTTPVCVGGLRGVLCDGGIVIPLSHISNHEIDSGRADLYQDMTISFILFLLAPEVCQVIYTKGTCWKPFSGTCSIEQIDILLLRVVS